MGKILFEKCEYLIRTVSSEEIEEAKEAGIKRRQLHSGYGSTKHWIDKREGQYSNEIWGCLGEIVFRTAIKRAKIEDICEYPSLYVNKVEDLKSLPDWDYLLDGKKIEVKTIPPDTGKICKKRLLVKVCEYKPMDFFVGIKFVNKEEYFFAGWCTDQELKENPPHNFGFTKSYHRLLSDLHLMKKEWWKKS